VPYITILLCAVVFFVFGGSVLAVEPWPDADTVRIASRFYIEDGGGPAPGDVGECIYASQEGQTASCATVSRVLSVFSLNHPIVIDSFTCVHADSGWVNAGGSREAITLEVVLLSSDADCVGADDPYDCCTGADAGGCDRDGGTSTGVTLTLQEDADDDGADILEIIKSTNVASQDTDGVTAGAIGVRVTASDWTADSVNASCTVVWH